MAFYADEEEVWKCQLHPSRRRTIGVCPYCLRERLSSLCPDCANVRPCSCCCSSSSSSSSSATSYGVTDTGNFLNASGSVVGKVSNLIESEPSFRRSRSAAFFPFFKSARYSSADTNELTKDRDAGDETASEVNRIRSKNSRSFWLFFWPSQRSRKEKLAVSEGEEVRDMRRSRSVAAVFTRGGGSGGRRDQELMRTSGVKSKGWYYFPSPMKAFRYSSSKASAKIVQDHSPLHRG